MLWNVMRNGSGKSCSVIRYGNWKSIHRTGLEWWRLQTLHLVWHPRPWGLTDRVHFQSSILPRPFSASVSNFLWTANISPLPLFSAPFPVMENRGIPSLPCCVLCWNMQRKQSSTKTWRSLSPMCTWFSSKLHTLEILSHFLFWFCLGTFGKLWSLPQLHSHLIFKQRRLAWISTRFS